MTAGMPTVTSPPIIMPMSTTKAQHLNVSYTFAIGQGDVETISNGVLSEGQLAVFIFALTVLVVRFVVGSNNQHLHIGNSRSHDLALYTLLLWVAASLQQIATGSLWIHAFFASCQWQTLWIIYNSQSYHHNTNSQNNINSIASLTCCCCCRQGGDGIIAKLIEAVLQKLPTLTFIDLCLQMFTPVMTPMLPSLTFITILFWFLVNAVRSTKQGLPCCNKRTVKNKDSNNDKSSTSTCTNNMDEANWCTWTNEECIEWIKNQQQQQLQQYQGASLQKQSSLQSFTLSSLQIDAIRKAQILGCDLPFLTVQQWQNNLLFALGPALRLQYASQHLQKRHSTSQTTSSFLRQYDAEYNNNDNDEAPMVTPMQHQQQQQFNTQDELFHSARFTSSGLKPTSIIDDASSSHDLYPARPISDTSSESTSTIATIRRRGSYDNSSSNNNKYNSQQQQQSSQPQLMLQKLMAKHAANEFGDVFDQTRGLLHNQTGAHGHLHIDLQAHKPASLELPFLQAPSLHNNNNNNNSQSYKPIKNDGSGNRTHGDTSNKNSTDNDAVTANNTSRNGESITDLPILLPPHIADIIKRKPHLVEQVFQAYLNKEQKQQQSQQPPQHHHQQQQQSLHHHTQSQPQQVDIKQQQQQKQLPSTLETNNRHQQLKQAATQIQQQQQQQQQQHPSAEKHGRHIASYRSPTRPVRQFEDYLSETATNSLLASDSTSLELTMSLSSSSADCLPETYKPVPMKKTLSHVRKRPPVPFAAPSPIMTSASSRDPDERMNNVSNNYQSDNDDDDYDEDPESEVTRLVQNRGSSQQYSSVKIDEFSLKHNGCW